ncbi:PqqA peptide cyclase [Austwickia sp. TVS 96-490-7B]|nr:PqqA peptide cyclase [Austwickia sp. TVS 96-490-7B]
MFTFAADDFAFRQEYFGGLLIRKSNNEIFEISKWDYIFLSLVREGVWPDQAESLMLGNFGVHFQPDLEAYEQSGFIVDQSTHGAPLPSVPLGDIDVSRLWLDLPPGYLCAPAEVSIYPTLRCQLSCDFCFAAEPMSQGSKRSEVSAATWLLTLESLAAAGTYSLSVLGGEPMQYGEIVPLLDGLNGLFPKMGLTSNGQSWSKELEEAVISCGNLVPCFSLQSLDDFNVRYMGRNFRIKRTTSLISRLLAGGRKSRINAVYSGQSSAQLRDLADFCDKSECEALSIAYRFDLVHHDSFREFRNVAESLREYIDQRGYCFTFRPEGCLTYTAYPEISEIKDLTAYQKLYFGCDAGKTRMEIHPSGDAYACAVLTAPETRLGNVFESGWSDVWNGSKVAAHLRTAMTKADKCHGCGLLEACNGGCAAVVLHATGELIGEADPRCLL